MLSKFTKLLADASDPKSLATILRKKRLKKLLKILPKKDLIKILDVGGTAYFWDTLKFPEEESNIQIILLNITEQKSNNSKIKSVIGDARDLSRFTNKEFDLVFSNSVIEHLNTFEDQKNMADEIRRVGKRYFVQTPNKLFPIEQHFFFPFFQFFPIKIQIWILTHLNLLWWKKIKSKEEAIDLISEIRLLSKKDMKILFPDSNIITERFLFLPKSIIAVKNFD